jgi:hypothetical protein
MRRNLIGWTWIRINTIIVLIGWLQLKYYSAQGKKKTRWRVSQDADQERALDGKGPNCIVRIVKKGIDLAERSALADLEEETKDEACKSNQGGEAMNASVSCMIHSCTISILVQGYIPSWVLSST